MAELLAWFWQTPLSRIATVAAVLIGLGLARPVARMIGWRLWGTGVALVSVGLALVPTFVSRIGYYDFEPDVRAVNDCVGGITRNWTEPEEFLNVVLLVPLGVGLMLASRSFATSAALVIAVAAGIELGQSFTGLGVCERGDLVRNAAGGLAAVASVWLLQLRRSPRPVSSSIR